MSRLPELLAAPFPAGVGLSDLATEFDAPWPRLWPCKSSYPRSELVCARVTEWRLRGADPFRRGGIYAIPLTATSSWRRRSMPTPESLSGSDFQAIYDE